MPRLVGEQKNHGVSVSLLVFVIAGVVVGLEYVGAIDVIPGFGRNTSYLSSKNHFSIHSVNERVNER